MIGKPVRHRTRDSSWQWLLIGITLGVGCSLVFCLASYVVGFIKLGEFSGLSTATIILEESQNIITATPNSAASPAVLETLATATLLPTDLPTASLEPTLLGSGSTGSPAPSLEGDGLAATEAVGTPFSTGKATITPSISSASPVPEALLSAATALGDIPGGSFTMGTTREEALAAVDACVVRDGGNCTETFVQDSIPPHQVTLDDFKIEIFEVSTTQYVGFLNQLLLYNPGLRADKIGCSGQPCLMVQEDNPQSIVRFNGTNYEVVNPEFYANHPITFVTWWGANEYCRAIGRRLPTEAEWERAARGPANSIYPWGQEWIPENAKTSRPVKDGTAAVDSYPTGVNPYGIYNMAGNVSEWVFDFYQSSYYGLPEAAGPNPTGPLSSDRKVARGGGWDNVPLFARSVHRIDVPPGEVRGSLGFRCAANK